MNRLIIAVAIIIVAAGAAVLNFTFTVTNASITSSETTISVSGPATLTVSGVGTDTGTFSASGSLANVSGGNVTVPFTVTLTQGSYSGTMTFPLDALGGSSSITGSATITSGTGRYAILVGTTISGSGFGGSVLAGGDLSFSMSGTADNRSFTFTVTDAPIVIAGNSVFSGPASLALAGFSPDSGTFTASGPLTALSGNLAMPFTVTLGRGTITGNMTFPETALLKSGPVSGSATITGGTGSYAGYTSATLTASGTVTGSLLSSGTLSFSVAGTITTSGPVPIPPSITAIENNSSFIPAGFPNSGIVPSSIFWIQGTGMASATTVTALQDSTKGLPATAGLNGAVVTVNAGGQTYAAGLYYAIATQIAGVLPAAVPPGPATVTVSYNGQTSAPYSFTVVPAAYGIDVYNGNYAILQDSVTGAIITPTNSAKPGEPITIWGTGIGSDPKDSDVLYTPTPHAIPTEVQVYIGNVEVPQSNILYVGSYGYPGVNGVVFTVPSNAPAGCFNSVAIVTTVNGVSRASNLGVGSFMPSGGVCQDANTGLDGNMISTLTQQANVKIGSLSVFQKTSPGTSGALSTISGATGLFEQVTGSNSLAGSAGLSVGSCSLSETLASNATTPTITALNPGTITVTPPGGSAITLQASPTNPYEYDAQVPSAAIPTSGGAFTFNGSGGSGANAVGPFSTTISFPGPLINWTNQTDVATVTRSAGLTYTWTDGAPDSWVIVSGSSASSMVSGTYTCIFSQSALTATVPPYLLSAMPAGSGTSSLENSTSLTSFTANGLDYGIAFGIVSFSTNSTYQ